MSKLIKKGLACALALILVISVSGTTPALAHEHTADCYCDGTVTALHHTETLDSTCQACGGIGQATCETCKGTGKITTSVTTTHTHSTECYTWNKVSTVVTNKKLASVTSRKYASYNTNASATWNTFYKNASAMDSEDVRTYLPLSSMQPGDLVVVKGTLKAYRAQKGDYYPQLMVKYQSSSGSATMPDLNTNVNATFSQHTTFLKYALYTGSTNSSKAVLPSGSWLGEEAIRKLVQGKYSYGEWMFFKSERSPFQTGDILYTYAPSDKLTIPDNSYGYPAAQLTDEYLTYIADDCCGVDGALPIFTGSNKEIIPNYHTASDDATIKFAGSGASVADQWVYTNQDFIYAFPLSKLSSSVTFNYISVGINNSNTGSYIVPDGTYSVEIWRQQRVCGKTAGVNTETTSVSCPKCNGSGLYYCSLCDGTGHAYTCPDCGGHKYAYSVCPYCEDGTVRNYYTVEDSSVSVSCLTGMIVNSDYTAVKRSKEYLYVPARYTTLTDEFIVDNPGFNASDYDDNGYYNDVITLWADITNEGKAALSSSTSTNYCYIENVTLRFYSPDGKRYMSLAKAFEKGYIREYSGRITNADSDTDEYGFLKDNTRENTYWVNDNGRTVSHKPAGSVLKLAVTGTDYYGSALKYASSDYASFEVTPSGQAYLGAYYPNIKVYATGSAEIELTLDYPGYDTKWYGSVCEHCNGTGIICNYSKPCKTCEGTGLAKVDKTEWTYYTCNKCGQGVYGEEHYGEPCGRRICTDVSEDTGIGCGHTRVDASHASLKDTDLIENSEGTLGNVVFKTDRRTTIATLMADYGINLDGYTPDMTVDCKIYSCACNVCGLKGTLIHVLADGHQTGIWRSTLEKTECVAPPPPVPLIPISWNIPGTTVVTKANSIVENGYALNISNVANANTLFVISASTTDGNDASFDFSMRGSTFYSLLRDGVISNLEYGGENVGEDELITFAKEGTISLFDDSLAYVSFICRNEDLTALNAVLYRDFDDSSFKVYIGNSRDGLPSPSGKITIAPSVTSHSAELTVLQDSDGKYVFDVASQHTETIYTSAGTGTNAFDIGFIRCTKNPQTVNASFTKNSADAQRLVFEATGKYFRETNLSVYDTDGYERQRWTIHVNLIVPDPADCTVYFYKIVNGQRDTNPFAVIVGYEEGDCLPLSVIPSLNNEIITTVNRTSHTVTSRSWDAVWYEDEQLTMPMTDISQYPLPEGNMNFYTVLAEETVPQPQYSVQIKVEGVVIDTQSVYEYEYASEPSLSEISSHIPDGKEFIAWSPDISSTPITADTVFTALLTDGTSGNEYQKTDEDADCIVKANIGASYFVSIPKLIVLDGTTGSGDYTVIVDADLGGMNYVAVVPMPSSSEGYVLHERGGRKDILFNVVQDKQYFIASTTRYSRFATYLGEEVSTDNLVKRLENDIPGYIPVCGEYSYGNGYISAEVPAGTWSGRMTFQIYLGNKNVDGITEGTVYQTVGAD